MATLTIYDLDEATIEQLRALARCHERGVSDQARAILEAHVRRCDRKAFRREIDAIASATPPVQQTDSVELLREDRWR
jgi:plasmid stability protein